MSINNDNIRELNYRSCTPYFILFDRELSANHLRFYGIVEQMESNPNPKVNPTFSYQWIADILGINRRNAIKIASEMKEKGYMFHIQLNNFKWIWTTRKGVNLDDDLDVSNDITGVAQRHPGVSHRDTPPVSHRDTHKYYKDNKYIKDINTTIENEFVDNLDAQSKIANSSNKEFFSEYKAKEFEALEVVNVEFQRQQKIQKFKEEALKDSACIEVFNTRWKGINVSLERLYEDCCDFYSQTNQMVFKARFLTHLKKAPLDNYRDIQENNPSKLTKDEELEIQSYISLCKARRQPDASVIDKINLTKEKLKRLNTAISREIIAAINNAEESLDAKKYKNLIMKAAEIDKTRAVLSDTAREALKETKRILGIR